VALEVLRCGERVRDQSWRQQKRQLHVFYDIIENKMKLQSVCKSVIPLVLGAKDKFFKHDFYLFLVF